MPKMVNLTIDGKAVSVPEGTLIVDAAKLIGIDIPVFCYHPKMEPVGMCRMCLVNIGRPVIDRATGQPVVEADGSPKIQFGPKLDTACTTPVSEGMVVDGSSPKVLAGRKDILEFLLTSHPLDCPICDKGGECPLQNLTMAWGPGESRFDYSEKMHLAKRVPLGELIYLDRERCIQCGRCVRFQESLAEDPVIGFFDRGRKIEIVTFSEPGFNSYWSGNTTDICPVGALTTTDFRFGARPWELKAGAALCTQCPVGCNMTFNIRREAGAGGEVLIKRAMPRQNEMVNEIWICDKGRFGYHYAQDPQRLTQPLVRKHGNLTPVTWEEALDTIAERFQAVRDQKEGNGLLTVAGGRLSNEDLFNLKELTDGMGGQTALYSNMAGGELTCAVGLAPGSNLGDLGKGAAVLVVASDLEEEAPIWWLRVKESVHRGATLVVMNPRPTKLDSHAAHVIRYPYGNEAAAVLALLNDLSTKRPDLPASVQNLSHSPGLHEAAKALAEAENLIVFYGSEGLGLAGSQALAQACANLLLATGHVGRPNNGLVGVWRRANDQGAWELGWRPIPELFSAMEQSPALYLAAADPAGDDPARFTPGGFLVVQDLYLTATARLADVVLPAQAWAEREGTYTTGERRVQRTYPVIPERPGTRADFQISGQIAERLVLKTVPDEQSARLSEIVSRSSIKVFEQVCAKYATFAELSYQRLSEVVDQWPIVGRSDLYYGGTTYDNHHGLGVQLPLANNSVSLRWPALPEVAYPRFGLLAVPVTRLYDQGATLQPTKLLDGRIPPAYVVLNPTDADRLHIPDGAALRISPVGGIAMVVIAKLNPGVPERVLLAPRSYGLAIEEPTPVEVLLAERVVQ